MAEPLTDIFNTGLKRGEYPDIYKFETCTPVPKKFPVKSISQLRNISGLFHFDKIYEKLISQLIISDMEASLDPKQFGNQKGRSIQHYLVLMIHKILEALDKNAKGEVSAVIVNLVDWENAFPRQCPTLGVKSFLKNGVRPSLIPILINYFQNRKMSVKWHGAFSTPRKIKGGGPQGATLGLLEYLSQSNDNADCVDKEFRFKFVDDLSILEVVNLLVVGFSTFDVKSQVPSDINVEDGFVPGENLKSQAWLNEISNWTKKPKNESQL